MNFCPEFARTRTGQDMVPGRLSVPTNSTAGTLQTFRENPGIHVLIWTTILIISAGAIGLVFWITERGREQALAAARAETQNLTRLLDQHAARTFDSIDMFLQTVAHEALHPGEVGHKHFAERMFDLTHESPHIRALKLIDLRTGVATRVFEGPRYLSRLSAGEVLHQEPLPHAERGIHIGRPFLDAWSGSWLVPVSRRIANRAGGSDQLAVVEVSLEYFQSFYERVNVGKQGSILLVRGDGIILTGRPYEASNVGRNISHADLFRELGFNSAGTYEANSITDGVRRIISYRRLPSAPLIIVASLAVDEVLAPWRAERIRHLEIAFASIAVLIFFGALLTREMQHRSVAEAKAREQAMHLHATLESMSQGLTMFDANGVLHICNQRAIELLGLPSELMSRKPTLDELRRYQHELGEFVSEPEEFRTWLMQAEIYDSLPVYHRTRANGTVLEIRTSLLPGGGAVRTYTDVTASRSAERAIEESEARYRLLADHATDMIVKLDLQGCCEYVSPACRHMLGYEPEEMMQHRPGQLVHPEDVSQTSALLQALFSGQLDRTASTYRVRRKSGEWIWVEANFQLVRDAAGQPAKIVGNIRDVTERQRQAEELKAAKEAAEQANQAKTDFLASMSHEIRTPLNGVLGYTDLLLQDDKLNDAQRRFAERIQGAGAALLTVVDDILDFSRIEAGRIELEPEAFSVSELIDNATSIARGLADKKHLPVYVELDNRLPAQVIGDQDRLRQILLNLLNNAVKFTPAGSVSLRVQQTGDQDGKCTILFSVADTGLGIPKEKQKLLFQRFSQADGSVRREFGGTGLGLAISKRLVELMGGEIGVHSDPGRGSTFWFSVTLPKGNQDVQVSETRKPEQRPSRGARILLVDDNDINQEIAQSVLTAAGHQVDVVSDGTDSVMAVQAKSYDLVFMDIQMPVMDGMTATKHIRGLEHPARNVPIIAMTANVLPQQVEAFKRAGMNDHLGKPFKREDMLAMVDRWALADGNHRPDEHQDREGGRFDAKTYGALLETIGQDAMSRLLDQLADQALACFEDRALLQNQEKLLANIQNVGSVARMLGFFDLAERCRELATAHSGGADLKEALIRAQAAREQVLADIAALRAA